MDMSTLRKLSLEKIIDDDRKKREENKLNREKLEKAKEKLNEQIERIDGNITGFKAGLVENRINNLKAEILNSEGQQDEELIKKLTVEVNDLQEIQKLQANIKGVGETDATINQKIKDEMNKKEAVIKKMNEIDRKFIKLQQDDFGIHEKFMKNLSKLEAHMDPSVRRKALKYMRDELHFEFLLLHKESGYITIQLEEKVNSAFLELYKGIHDLGKLGASLENKDVIELADALSEQLTHMEQLQENVDNPSFFEYNAAILKIILHSKDDELSNLEHSKFKYILDRLIGLVDTLLKSPPVHIESGKKVAEEALQEELAKSNFKKLI